jgi:hypothetical protein
MSVISGQETSFMHGLYEIAMDLIQQNILPACNVIFIKDIIVVYFPFEDISVFC